MQQLKRLFRSPVIVLVALGLFVTAVAVQGIPYAIAVQQNYAKGNSATTTLVAKLLPPAKPELDTKLFDRQLEHMANYASTTATSSRIWPVDTAYPKAGAIMPMKRIVAYYGNFYSTRMGILGEFEPDVVIARLKQEVAKWEAADPLTKVVPAIDYIAVTAQGTAQPDGKYRLRMPDAHIEKAIAMGRQIDGITVLEIQAGLASLQGEIESFEKYLSMPDVHLAIDPEFNMKGGEEPGTVIGTVSAGDINRASAYLAALVQEHDLPPKVLVVHRFTQRMVTNYEMIETRPEVQIVIVMDGWGPPGKKINTYKHFIAPEPVEFTGFKIFYKNDMKPPSERLLTPQDLLKLTPRPMYIQYQ